MNFSGLGGLAPAVADVNFWTSAGFGGLAAVVAATIAFIGLMVRLRSDRLEDTRQSTQAVNAGRDEDARARWWEAVNWVWDNRDSLDDSTKITLIAALVPLAKTSTQVAFLKSAREASLPLRRES